MSRIPPTGARHSSWYPDTGQIPSFALWVFPALRARISSMKERIFAASCIGAILGLIILFAIEAARLMFF
jgi:hypothetical protein